ncbi:TetR/AcrR family transcriptional regulator [Nocardia carnea]|uniref:TetR/AcrR family transcriptional regulator n=1 Tax=Nocardia carnea TaxID=37328 RepID=UPI00245651A5|nr:TetR/AcrR family transcriptional regulator [Nocardia carnea]
MTAIRSEPERATTSTAEKTPTFQAGGGKRNRRSGERRTALLHAALELFATRPYEDVSVDDICTQANVAHGLLSYHFGGKRQLFAAAVGLAWDELVAHEKPLESEQTVVEKFHGHLSRRFDYFRSYPERFRLMTRSGHVDPQVSEMIRSARQKAIAEIESFLGCPENAPLELRTAIAGWAGFVDTITQEYVENSALEIDKITDMCAQALAAAVRSASGIHLDPAVELEAISRVAGVSPSPAEKNPHHG